MTALLARVPRAANRWGGGLVAVPLDGVDPGDLLLVRAGEAAPVDGVVRDGVAVLGESALTGEAFPVAHGPGERVRSGAVNAGAPFDHALGATAWAASPPGRPRARKGGVRQVGRRPRPRGRDPEGATQRARPGDDIEGYVGPRRASISPAP